MRKAAANGTLRPPVGGPSLHAHAGAGAGAGAVAAASGVGLPGASASAAGGAVSSNAARAIPMSSGASAGAARGARPASYESDGEDEEAPLVAEQQRENRFGTHMHLRSRNAAIKAGEWNSDETGVDEEDDLLSATTGSDCSACQ